AMAALYHASARHGFWMVLTPDGTLLSHGRGLVAANAKGGRARGEQTSRVSNATSARPPASIDQSPMSKPRSRRSVLEYAIMFSSRWSNCNVSDECRLGCCGRATTDEKRISF